MTFGLRVRSLNLYQRQTIQIPNAFKVLLRVFVYNLKTFRYSYQAEGFTCLTDKTFNLVCESKIIQPWYLLTVMLRHCRLLFLKYYVLYIENCCSSWNGHVMKGLLHSLKLVSLTSTRHIQTITCRCIHTTLSTDDYKIQ